MVENKACLWSLVSSLFCGATLRKCLTVSFRASIDVCVMYKYIYIDTPTLQKLLKALKTLDDWFIFGIKLSVPFSQLKKIESSYTQRELERCKTDMLQYWLDNRLVPKWNEVILALEETDQLALAAQIKHDYLWSASAASKEGVYIKCLNRIYTDHCV